MKKNNEKEEFFYSKCKLCAALKYNYTKEISKYTTARTFI